MDPDIFAACVKEDVAVIQQLLASGTNINIQTKDGDTPLLQASAAGQLQVVKLLIGAGANLDTPNVQGMTPLHAAFANGHREIVMKLVTAGADINIHDKRGNNLLNLASEAGQLEVVTLLIKSGVNVNRPSGQGSTALQVAGGSGHLDMVKLLIKSGANINKPGSRGLTALHASCTMGYLEVAKQLLVSGANIDDRDEFGDTPLHPTCAFGHLDVVEFLIEAGAKLNTPGILGMTPLHAAFVRGQPFPAVIEKLVAAGTDINIQDKDGKTPLYLASASGQVDMVELLIRSGAHLDAPGILGKTPLHAALARGHLEVVKKLVQAGANIHIEDKDGNNPLYLASAVGKLDVVELFIRSGANVNAIGDQGITPMHAVSGGKNINLTTVYKRIYAGTLKTNRLTNATPLHVASAKGYNEIAEVLLKAGANVNAKTVNGATPLYLACQNGHQEVVQLLLTSKADMEYSKLDGESPLWVACHNGHIGVARLLLSPGTNVNKSELHDESTLFSAINDGYIRVVQVLLSLGAEVNSAQTITGVTCLYMACKNGHLDVVKLLLSLGADVNKSRDNGKSPLFIASYNGHHDIVHALLLSGANVNASSVDGVSPLWIACQEQHVHVVQFLLSSDADVNSTRTSDGISALYIASEVAGLDVVQLLLSYGADSNRPRDDGMTPLTIACQEGHTDIVRSLLSSGADTNRPRDDGTSPLLIASTRGDNAIVRLLLSYGANVNQRDNKGRLWPLYVACGKGHLNVVQLLCGAGADVNAMHSATDATPLYNACNGGHLEVIHFLLEQQSRPSGTSIENNMSLLQAYCMSCCQIDMLTRERVYLFINILASLLSDYKSVCHVSDHFTTVLDLLLLTRTSPCTVTDTLIETLGYFMAVEGKLNKPLYAILPETEATKGKPTDSNSLHTTFSALVCALNTKRLEVFLNKVRDECGQNHFLSICKGLLCQNTLHIIAQYLGNLESVEKAQLLLDLHVDVWAKDINGRLPFHIACKMGNTQLAKCYWTAMKQADKDCEMNQTILYCRQSFRTGYHDPNSGDLTHSFLEFVKQKPDQYTHRMLDKAGMLPTDYIDSIHRMNEPINGLPESIQSALCSFGNELTVSQVQSIKFGDISNEDMDQLLNKSPRGKILITGENKLIFLSVLKLVKTISQCIGILDPCFACKPVLSGSVYGGTKTAVLDELDFCLKLVNFEATAQTDLESDGHILVAKCSPPPSYVGKYWRLTSDGTSLFASTLYCAKFWQLLIKALSLPALSEYVSLSQLTIDDCTRKSGFVGMLSLTWHGKTYPCLQISVDLVPVVELEDYYCLIRPRYFDYQTIGYRGNIALELSSNKKDKAIMASMTVTHKEAYCLAKIIRGLATTFTSKSGRILTNDQAIQSYLLKTNLMWVVDPEDRFHEYYADLSKDDILAAIEYDSYPLPASHIQEVRIWTMKIFTMLKYILESRHEVHTYSLPFDRQDNVVRVRDRELTIALCEKCIEIARPR